MPVEILSILQQVCFRVVPDVDALTEPEEAMQAEVVVLGYDVYRENVLLGRVRPNAYVDFTVVAGTAYRYRVSAIDQAHKESVRSAQVQITA